MNLGLSASAEHYRAGLKDWVSANLPPRWRDIPVGTGDDESYVAMRREWGRRLFEAGWAGAENALVDAFVRTRVVDSTVRRVFALNADGAEPGMLAPIAKVLWSESHQKQLATLLEAAGPEVAGADAGWSDWTRALMFARAETIYGGTSEIQRNLIAKALGLPSDR